VRSEDSQNF